MHIHTHFSDGTSSPREVVEEAVQARLGCIAITDHDTVDGIVPAREAAASFGLEVLAGIELSSEDAGKDVHILGYLFDLAHEGFQRAVEQFQQARTDRIHRMIEKLKTVGVDNITFEDVAALAQSRALGRLHLATVLKAKGHINDVRQAFPRYIGEGAPAYEPKFKITPEGAIDLIHQAGGIAVMAHPMVTNKDEIIPRLVEAGLDGLEVYYPNTSGTVIQFYEGIAQKHGLLRTGGSDAHGKAKRNTWIAKTMIPYDLVDRMKERAASRMS
ncbi:MAG: PHP domain-containing protein [Candidatus Omnitrophota bacterium]|nr:PHP domain-containing protein [Candidatus Omnitrophota bacterium]MDZ4241344.1 PHP domain-containing protein [Candidatus Omnitrophota bacterium]